MIKNLDEIKLIVRAERPPIWDKVHKYFQVNDAETVYAYGHILYNPADIDIDILLLEHERACANQQISYEGGIEAWWDRYLTDAEFKKDQDFEQFWYQYRKYCSIILNKDKRFKYRWQIAGTFVDMIADKSIGRMEACNLLKTNIHK